jgi:hypothetical protein
MNTFQQDRPYHLKTKQNKTKQNKMKIKKSFQSKTGYFENETCYLTGNKLVIAHLNLTIVQIAEDNKIVIILTNMETE